MLTRRGLLAGFAGLLGAPAIVRAGSLMPVRRPVLPVMLEPSHMYFLNTTYLGDWGGFKRYAGYEVLQITPEAVILAANHSLRQAHA